MRTPCFNQFFNKKPRSASFSIHFTLSLSLAFEHLRTASDLPLPFSDLSSYRSPRLQELLRTLQLLYLELAIIRLHLLPALTRSLWVSLYLSASIKVLPPRISLNFNTPNALIYPLLAQQTAFCCLTLYLVFTVSSWIWRAAF